MEPRLIGAKMFDPMTNPLPSKAKAIIDDQLFQSMIAANNVDGAKRRAIDMLQESNIKNEDKARMISNIEAQSTALGLQKYIYNSWLIHIGLGVNAEVIIKQLVTFADSLDKKGFAKEANEVDRIVKAFITDETMSVWNPEEEEKKEKQKKEEEELTIEEWNKLSNEEKSRRLEEMRWTNAAQRNLLISLTATLKSKGFQKEAADVDNIVKAFYVEKGDDYEKRQRAMEFADPEEECKCGDPECETCKKRTEELSKLFD